MADCDVKPVFLPFYSPFDFLVLLGEWLHSLPFQDSKKFLILTNKMLKSLNDQLYKVYVYFSITDERNWGLKKGCPTRSTTMMQLASKIVKDLVRFINKEWVAMKLYLLWLVEWYFILYSYSNSSQVKNSCHWNELPTNWHVRVTEMLVNLSSWKVINWNVQISSSIGGLNGKSQRSS